MSAESRTRLKKISGLNAEQIRNSQISGCESLKVSSGSTIPAAKGLSNELFVEQQNLF